MEIPVGASAADFGVDWDSFLAEGMISLYYDENLCVLVQFASPYYQSRIFRLPQWFHLA